MGSAGASALVKGKKRLAHLDRIDLTKNYLDEDAQEELIEAFGQKVDVSDQNDSDEVDYRVQVAD